MILLDFMEFETKRKNMLKLIEEKKVNFYWSK